MHALGHDVVRVGRRLIGLVRRTIRSLVVQSWPNLLRRRYSKVFDEQSYLDANPDIAAAMRAGVVRSAFKHFIRFGRYELGSEGTRRRLVFSLRGYRLDFDETAYLADNTDVSAFVAKGTFSNGFEHFLAAGYTECLAGERLPYSVDRRVRLLEQKDGHATLINGSRYVCLFAHYDREGIIDAYVIEYLKALKNSGIDCYFITTTTDETEHRKLLESVIRIFVKNDAGRDFGSWYIALRSLGLETFDRYEYLILANDSIYFPVNPLDRLFREMNERQFNLWSITDSRELGVYHLQSFFLAFDKIARDSILTKFIASYDRNVYLNKWGQIVEYEFGLTKDAMDAGLRVGAYCSIDDIREVVIRDSSLVAWRKKLQLSLENVNPMHELWDLLLIRYRCPAIKLELLRENPRRVSIRNWKRLIEPSCINPSVIEDHVRRSKLAKGQRKKFSHGSSSRTKVELKNEIAGIKSGKAERLVVYAHFDPEDVIDDHVVRSVSALNAANCDVLFVTATSQQHELGKVLPWCHSVLVKNAVGRDFGSWYIATKTRLDAIREYQTVIWMNDSSYFPLFDPNDMFRSIASKSLDFWGIVDSYFGRWHVMSWFWAFERSIVQSDWFERYVEEYNVNYSKWDQIKNYEMQYPLLFKRQGLRVGAYVSADDVHDYVINKTRREVRKDFTMTHIYWDTIIAQFKCPALKVELLRDNPLGMNVSGVYDFIAQHTDYDPQLIRAHIGRLRRVGRIPDRDYCGNGAG
jgi:lipopolysaccharide biosynthesis protein